MRESFMSALGLCSCIHCSKCIQRGYTQALHSPQHES
jgi:hypothetical protein